MCAIIAECAVSALVKYKEPPERGARRASQHLSLHQRPTPLFPWGLTFSILPRSSLNFPKCHSLLLCLLYASCLYLGDIFHSFHRDCSKIRNENNNRVPGRLLQRAGGHSGLEMPRRSSRGAEEVETVLSKRVAMGRKRPRAGQAGLVRQGRAG